jgi:MarR family transcriptional repressor of emrRAB
MADFGPETGERSDYPARTAASYKEAFPWADLAAMKVSLKVIQSAAAQSTALNRFHASFGATKSHGRYTLLRILYFAEGEHLTQNELSNRMKVTSANITYLIDVLEKEGLVARSADAADRRVSHVELTPAGVEVCKKQVPAMADFMGQMSQGLTEGEKALFYEFLERFRRNAEKYGAIE